jgi:hypothetical protein
LNYVTPGARGALDYLAVNNLPLNIGPHLASIGLSFANIGLHLANVDSRSAANLVPHFAASIPPHLPRNVDPHCAQHVSPCSPTNALTETFAKAAPTSLSLSSGGTRGPAPSPK